LRVWWLTAAKREYCGFAFERQGESTTQQKPQKVETENMTKMRQNHDSTIIPFCRSF